MKFKHLKQHRNNIFDRISVHTLSRCPKLQFHAIQDLGIYLSYSLFSERNLFLVIMEIVIEKSGLDNTMAFIFNRWKVIF